MNLRAAGPGWLFCPADRPNALRRLPPRPTW